MSASILFATSLLMSASGCKKKFDPNEFDAGAATAASGSAAASATPPVDSSAATDTTDAGDGLAPLVTGKGHTAAATGGAATAAAGGGGATKPRSEPPECAQARHFCNEVPVGERHKPANEKSCNDARFACFNKGGHL